jgi:iron complex transport system substrate-binding protein
MKNLLKILFVSSLGILLVLPTHVFAENAWPRVHTNPDGSKTTIQAPPKRILSTAVSITGTLLAIGAPVVASATDYNGNFFGQWRHVAQENKVQKLWSIAEVDLEAAYSVRPDLIIIAVGGRDTAAQHRAVLEKIAPTITVDYASQSWQSLARIMGQATGLENQAEDKIAEFEQHLNAAKAKLRLPEGKVNLIGYNGPGMVNPIATATGSHGSLLTALGFDVERPNKQWHGALDNPDDFVKAEYERLTELKAETTFLVRTDEDGARLFKQDKVLANLASVKNNQVYGLGKNSFRIDFYSSMEIIDDMLKRFASPNNSQEHLK